MTTIKVNTRKILSIVLSILIIMSMIPMSVFAAESEGYDGTPVTPKQITKDNYISFGFTEDNWSEYENYYGIRNAAELYGFAELVNTGNNRINGVLLQDIVVNTGTVTENGSSSGTTHMWTPIGMNYSFIGKFDGNGYTISGLYFNEDDFEDGENRAYIGLFASIGTPTQKSDTTVENVVLSNSYFEATAHIGAIVACAMGYGNSIKNCRVSENVTLVCATNYTGGILGNFEGLNYYYERFRVSCTISNCAFLGKISTGADFGLSAGNDHIGAIVGSHNIDSNAYKFVVADNCYYINGCITDYKGKTHNYGIGGYDGYNHNGGCKNLSSADASHTCVSVNHKEIKPTCEYTGRSEYSFCLICDKITEGTKTEYSATGHTYSTATCTEASTCIYCGDFKGDVDADNHTGSYNYVMVDETYHYGIWDCCEAKTENEKHDYQNGACTLCSSVCDNHIFENGFCVNGCSDFEPATEVSDKYDVNGDGYTDQVYEIANAGQLYWFAALVNGTLDGVQQNARANAVLTADIVVNENVLNDDYTINGDGSKFLQWTPIMYYRGFFDGKGYTISGLYCDTDNICVGLFGYTTREIKNIGVLDSYFLGYDSVGSIIGHGETSGSVLNCYAEAVVKATRGDAGGLIGFGSTDINGENYRSVSVYNSYFRGVSSGANIVSSNYPTLENVYYLAETDNGDGGKTAEQFASGEVAYLLGSAWGQKLGEEAYPNLKSPGVYYGYSCYTDEFLGYTNDKYVHLEESHYDANGFCSRGCYEPATLNEDGYYEIYNAGQLYWFAMCVNGELVDSYNAILMNDIVINENVVDENGNLTSDTASLREWTPIGDGTYTQLNGVFDGNGYTISGIYMNDSSVTYSAFVGGLSDGCVKNLGITDSYIGGARCAALVAVSNGTVENCFVTDTAIKGETAADYFVLLYNNADGENYPKALKNSYSTATVYENGVKLEAPDAYYAEYNENIYYLADTDNGEGGKTAKQFANGEVAFLLGTPWGQEIEVDALPVLNGKTVYKGFDCGGINPYYSNSELLGENDNNHIHTEWEYVLNENVHQRYICTREGCSQYMVIEYENCYGGEATCQNQAVCSVCLMPYGEYDTENHESNETYFEQGDENGHKLYHSCCNAEIGTFAHSDSAWDFDDEYHWESCICGYTSDVVKSIHNFNGNGFCTECGGYEPATIVYDEGMYAYTAEIYNAGQLFWYAKNCTEQTLDGDGDGYGDNVGAVLMSNIYLNPGYTFSDDGSYTVDETAEYYSETLREWSPIKNFAWVDFDGNGYTIDGLYINNPDLRYAALFASNDYYTIKNLTVENGFVYGKDYVAGIVAYNSGSVINCHSGVSVMGSGTVGGVIGYHAGAEISGCSNSGSVVIYGASSATGGIVASIYDSGTITNCYNTGYIKGGINVGGIVGDGGNATVSNCYNTGIVLSNFKDAHNIAGGNATVENCYYFAGSDNGDGGKTAEQFASGEVAYLLQAGQPLNDIYDEEWNIIGTEQDKVWYQTIGTDEYPVFDSASLWVYRNQIGGCCEENSIYEYSNTEKAPVTKHSYIGGITTKPTCTVEGVMTYTCACGDTYTERLGYLDHEYDANGECACGNLDYFIIDKLSSQIRFGKNDDESYSHKFDVRTRAKISEEDFERFVGATWQEAVANIKKVGFVYSINPESFSMDDAAAVAIGTEISGYTDAPISYIQDAGEYYTYTCIVTNIPEKEIAQTLVSFAYICVEIDGVEKWYFMNAQAEADFNWLYTTYIPMACEANGWEVLGDEVEYTWADDYSTCTASKICETCGEFFATETVATVTDTESTDGNYYTVATFSEPFETQRILSHTIDENGIATVYTATGISSVIGSGESGTNVKIVLGNDINLGSSRLNINRATVDLDLNGKTLTSTNINGTIYNSYGTIILSDSGVNGAVTNYGGRAALYNGATATINGGRFDGSSFAIYNTKNMTINYAESNTDVINSKGTLVIEDGNISSVISYDDTTIKGGYFGGITAMTDGTVTIEYCTLDGDLFINGGTIEVFGGNYKKPPTSYVYGEDYHVVYDDITQYYVVSRNA